MREGVKIQVGVALAEDLAAFAGAWKRAETGDRGAERVLVFERGEGLASVLTGERYRLLRRLHAIRKNRSTPWPRRWAASTTACWPRA